MAEPLDVLRSAFTRYDRARGAGDRGELVASRVALCAALARTGWDAPPEVAAQLARDDRTLTGLRTAAQEELFVRAPSHRPPDSVGGLAVAR